MPHQPIVIKDLSLSFPQKVCFDNFSTTIACGSRIAIIGRNGAGKSSLINLIRQLPVPCDVTIGYVPQILATDDPCSGSEQLHRALTAALVNRPNVLLLDEPTNHLDRRHRQNLLRMLRSFPGTIILASHDPEILTTVIETLWYIDQGKVHVFHGNYQDYQKERQRHRSSLQHQVHLLSQEKKEVHLELMQEQERAKKSKARGEKHIQQRKWPTVVSDEKARRAIETSGRKKSAINSKKQHLVEELAALTQIEVVTPKFSLAAAGLENKTILAIKEASVGYERPLLSNIHLSLLGAERVAVVGDNGSGKSTLIKAILQDPGVVRTGEWLTPRLEDIGYLDQQYRILDLDKTVLETIQSLVPQWSHADCRRHLNDFLFFKNEEVNVLVRTLSGGERARLILAQIAASPPKLLILDEVTNNLDLETRAHVIEVLKAYPGAIIVISHDEDFLAQINLTRSVNVHHFHKDQKDTT